MLPRVSDMRAPAPLHTELIAELRLRGFEGDLVPAYGDRVVSATDNSIYQLLPQLVVFPRGVDDLVRIARIAAEPRFKDIVFAPRGGGTGTNGQSLTEGLVVDVSRHMNRILEINPAERWVRVQAGVVKDQLNAALADHGLFFPLELSTSNRATIGGMISTDASGQGSCLYGKTRNHVLELITVLLDGTVWTSRPLQDQELQHIQRRADLVGAVHRLVLVQDAFTSWYESHVVLAVLDLMQAIDFRPYIAPFRPNGKPSHLHGFLGAFTRAATCNAAMLRDLAAIGVELVGVDASMTLTYRSEYGMLDEADRPPPVLLIQEWLALHRDAIPKAPSAGDEYLLLPHCSERSLALSSLRHWQTAFAAAGASLRVLPSGCCGMAGTYGHEAEHLTTSEQIYGMSWGRQVGKWAQSGHLLAAGYSCRSQVKIMDRQVLAHPAQALLACLGRS